MYLDFRFYITVFRITVLSQLRFYNGKKHWPKKEKNCICAHTYIYTHTQVRTHVWAHSALVVSVAALRTNAGAGPSGEY